MLKISSYFQLNDPIYDKLLKNAEPLLIGYPEPTDIFFLYKPLLDQRVGGKSAFYRLNIQPNKHNTEVILLRFFVEYREVDILILSKTITNHPPLDKVALNKRFEIINQQIEVVKNFCKDEIVHLRRYSCWVNEAFPKDELIKFAAIFLGDRNLKTIESNLLSTDKGFFFQIIEPYHYALYERYIVMYGLLLAYQISLEIFITELAFFTLDKVSSLEQLRKECAQFNAIFYFNNPIKIGNSNLRPTWNKLMQPFNMKLLTAELTDQLDAVTQIHHIEQERQHREIERLENEARIKREELETAQEKKHQQRQNKFNFWLSTIGILLTALTVVEVTPSALQQFVQEWIRVFANLLLF
jgi:hypothetical protein